MNTSVIFTVLFLLLTIQSFGQNLTGKGTYSINGTISFTSYSQENVDNTSILIFNPGAAYFIIDNFSLGLGVNLQEVSSGGNSNTNWAVGPTARFYLGKEPVKPFFMLGYAYGKQSSSFSNNDVTENDIQLAAGMDLFLNDNVAVETIVSYTFINLEYPSTYSLYYSIPSHEVQRKALSIGIGVNVFLR